MAEERQARAATDASLVSAIERLTASQLSLQATVLKKGKKKARFCPTNTDPPVSPLRGMRRGRDDSDSSSQESDDDIDKWADGETNPAGGSGSEP